MVTARTSLGRVTDPGPGVIARMKLPITPLRPITIAFALSLVVVALAVIVTTKTTKKAGGMTFYENTTLKFMVSVVSDRCVDPTGQRLWAATWPGGTKCIAGVNVPFAGRQITFHLLRWSWRG